MPRSERGKVWVLVLMVGMAMGVMGLKISTKAI
jgi:hypothetical protein